LELLINDGKNDYNLFIDGKLEKVISTTSTQAYPVSLPQGTHRVLLTKRTGPNFGAGQFKGIRLPQGGDLIALPATPNRRIEFIGDSHTVGYGNEGPALDCKGVYRPYENSYLSFAAVAARAMNADSRSIAISGFGAVRNYADSNTTSAMPMPYYYNRTLMNRADLSWNFKTWVPEVVVIKLGTNDYSTQPYPAAQVFIQGIHDLINQVRTAYGTQTRIFLVADNSLTQPVANMQTAVQQQRSMGFDRVHFVQLSFPPQNQLGCDWHPSVTGAEAMANQLVAAVKPVMGWSDAAQ
jgi:lysophospholipase L1-like esterase